MRKRRGNCLIEQLEQRRLLSAGIIADGSSLNNGGLNNPLSAPAPTTGDLGIDGIGIFDTAVAGGTIGVACDVVQTNAMTHVDYTISMVLSGDNVYGNADDIGLDTSSYTHGGGSQFANIPIPATTPAGNYHLLVEIAPGSPSEAGQTFPTDTNPNDDVLDTGVIPVLAAGTGIGSPQPTDYAIVSASTPASAAAGGFIDVVPQVVQMGVATDGNATVVNGSFYTVNVSLSTDNVWGNGDDIALSAVYPLGGEPLFGGFSSGNLQIPSDVAAGNYQLLMKVSSAFDSPSQPTDSNPGDDVLDVGTISVSPYVAADIGIKGATIPSTAPAGTGEIDVEPQIVRTGALADVDYNVSVFLSTDGSSFSYALSPDQASDSDYPLFHSGQIFVPNAAPPGTYHVLMEIVPATSSADYYLQNVDSDSSNNLIDAGLITLTPNDTNDIGVTGATFPTSAAAGSTIKVDPTLVQTGALSYPDFRVSVALSSSGTWGDGNNILLENSDSSSYSDEILIPSSVAAGTYQLLVDTQAQPSGEFQPPADTDPGDDMIDAGQITITPPPILASPPSEQMALTSVSFPSTAEAGSEIDIEPTANEGVLANYQYTISFALSTDASWGNSDDIPVLPLGDIPQQFHGGNVAISSSVPAGTYQLLLNVSLVNAASEYNTVNIPADQAAVDAGIITITADTGDMALTSASYPATAEPGTQIDIEPTVTRSGDLSSSDYNVSVYLSPDGDWSNPNNVSLTAVSNQSSPDYPAFHSGEMSIPSTVAPGNYQLLMYVFGVDWTFGQNGFVPEDGDPNNNRLDAGTITITSSNPPTGTTPPLTGSAPAPTGDLGLTSATFPTTAAANSVIDVEPAIVRTGAFTSYDYQVTAVLSTDDVWGNSDDIALVDDNGVDSSGLNGDGDLNYDNTQSPFHSGDMGISSDVPAGTYHLFLSIGVSYSDTFVQFGQTPPVDVNSADNILDAGTITITPYIAPDLGISSATFPATAAAGTNIDIEPTIIQVGGFENYGYSVTAVLSKDDTLRNSDDISLMQGNGSGLFSDLNYDGSSNSSYHSGNLMIPSNVAPGVYHLFLSVAESDESLFIISPAPTDSNPADNTLDAGTITVTANSSVNINPGGPIQNSTPSQIAEALAGQLFHVPSSSSGKYSALYLSSNTTLEVPRHSSQKLLKAGATVTLGTPDAKLKMKANQSSAIPQNTAPGLYYLLATTKNGSQVIDVGTIMVDAGTPEVQAVVHPKNKSAAAGNAGSVNLTFRNIGSGLASDLPVNLYLSTDQSYSDDDAQLIAGALSTVTIAPHGSLSKSYVTEFPATLAADKYYILACTDVDGTISVIGISPKTINVS